MRQPRSPRGPLRRSRSSLLAWSLWIPEWWVLRMATGIAARSAVGQRSTTVPGLRRRRCEALKLRTPARRDRLQRRGAGLLRLREVKISLIGLALGVACLAGITAACSGHNPADGTLTGHLYGVGGPAPGLARPWPGTVTLVAPASTVTFRRHQRHLLGHGSGRQLHRHGPQSPLRQWHVRLRGDGGSDGDQRAQRQSRCPVPDVVTPAPSRPGCYSG